MSESALEGVRARVERAAEGYRYQIHRSEQGTVLAVGDGIAQVSGLSSVGLDEMLRFESGAVGMALDLGRQHVGAVLLSGAGRVRAGEAVLPTGQVVTTSVGDGLLGRVVDALGIPLDGGGPVEAADHWPLERPAPEVVERDAVTVALHTGVGVIDALFPIGRGQRELIIGDRGTGRTALAVDAIISQRTTGVRCVYASIGQQSSEALSVVETLTRAGVLDQTIVVVARADAPPGVRYLAPYAACTMAEYFRDRGEDALLVLDDLSRHAVAYREVSLLLRRPPGREAYPGDIFYAHSRLLERATRLSKELGGGSLTALPIAETQAGRISDFIPTNLISITDGQLYLDPQLFDRGFKPAVNVGQSVSRVGGKTQNPAMKAVAGPLRLDSARFREVEVFSRFGARIEEETRRLLVRGARIREVLKQPPADPIPLGEQVAVLVALDEGLFDPVAIDEVLGRALALRQSLRKQHAALLDELAHGGPPAESARQRVRAVFEGLAEAS